MRIYFYRKNMQRFKDDITNSYFLEVRIRHTIQVRRVKISTPHMQVKSLTFVWQQIFSFIFIDIQFSVFRLFLDYNKCVEEPGFCLNGATCERTWTSARCHCADRYKGGRCDNCTENFKGDCCQECAQNYYGNNCGNDFS